MKTKLRVLVASICFSASFAILHLDRNSTFRTVDTDTMTTYFAGGAKCKGRYEDTSACTGIENCLPPGSIPNNAGAWKQEVYTGQTKVTCNGSASGNKTCACSENTPLTCTGFKPCSGTNCTSCGSTSPETTVDTVIHLGGDSCTADSQCEADS